jgi:ribosome-associated protein
MQTKEFRMRGEFIQLDQLLKVTGLSSSGGAAHAAIEVGQVQVDGQVELRKRAKLRAGQRVQFAGQEIVIQAAAPK